jgi:alcohol dehydrogenase
MGGAKAILATVTSADAMQRIAGGLGVNGTMMVIGAVGALTVDPLDLLRKRAAVKGRYSGTSVDSEDTLAFSRNNGIASMNEILPLEQAQGQGQGQGQAAYDRMMSGKARFRVVPKVD